MIRFSKTKGCNKIWILFILSVACLFMTIGTYAQSKSKIEKEKIPKEKGTKMVADVLDGFGGKSESDNLKIQISAGGQPSSIGKSQGTDHKVLAGYVYAAGLPSIAVISPNGGEVWVSGSQHYIRWSSDWFAGSVRIDYSTNSGVSFDYPIESSYPNTGEYLWTIPDISSTHCRVRVCDASDYDPGDMSDNDFTIYHYGPQVPIFNEFGLIGLLILLMGTGVWIIKRKRLATERNN